MSGAFRFYVSISLGSKFDKAGVKNLIELKFENCNNDRKDKKEMSVVFYLPDKKVKLEVRMNKGQVVHFTFSWHLYYKRLLRWARTTCPNSANLRKALSEDASLFNLCVA